MRVYTQVLEAFRAAYGSFGDVRSFFAPGRVNLIGEYTDFNGGHVLPCALTIGTYAVARKREDSCIRLFSVNFKESGVLETTLQTLEKSDKDSWGNYPKGVASILIKEGCAVDSGFDIAFGGNIPNGAGLSSSASIEVVTTAALNALFKLKITPVRQAVLARKAENEYIGVNCGIMDQFAIAMGKQDHAVLLNTDTMRYEHVPLQLKGYRIVIANTNRRRGLADSKYNERFSECREALADLQKITVISTLGDLNLDQFNAAAYGIKRGVVLKRARHVVSENMRTLQAIQVLEAGDLKGFGNLMNESHRSLREDFEVSCKELDLLVALAQAHEGVLGARLTGAGFGGCTVNLVDESQVADFIRCVGETYRAEIGYNADFYVVEAGDGAREITDGEALCKF